MEPTVTDAYVAAGIIDPAKFLGGRLPLDPGLAQRALDGIGARLGLDHAETASSVLDVTTANMYAQLLPLMARRGIDPRDFALLAYGGAGPTHALLLAKEVGIKTVIVPPSPGTLCALGCLVADIKHDVIKTLYVDSRHLTYEDFEMELASLVASASRWLSAQNAPVERSFAIRSLDMRYKGQSFDITVPLPDRLSPERGMDHVREMFHRAYQRVYEVSDPAVPVEIINLRVTIVGVTSKPGRLGVSSASGSPATREGRRSVVVSRQRALARVVDLRAFGEGTHVEGPAVVESEMATVFIPAGYTAAADRFGNIVVNELP
jgi:N-methylhydantoinase A